MRAKLDEDKKKLFKELDVSGYTLSQLSNYFEISVSTAERYRNPKYRELGRIIQRRRNQREKTCYKCGLLLSTHARCPTCEILVHDKEFCTDEHSLLALTNPELV